MKKFLSILLSVMMVVCFAVPASAETTESSFAMTTNTGILNLKGEIAYQTAFEPDLNANDSIILKANDILPTI